MIRVLLAEDHALVREALGGLLRREPDMELVGEASCGEAAVTLARELRPHVVVMDVSMPRMGGIDATARILADEPSTRVIGLSAHHEPKLVSAMIQVGAAGYVVKESSFRDLVLALRATMANQTYLSPAIAGVLVDEFRAQRGDVPGVHGRLSPRERQVASLLAEGLSTKEIAAQLGVSIKTVGTHREHVMAKLGIRSVAELTRLLISDGLA